MDRRTLSKVIYQVAIVLVIGIGSIWVTSFAASLITKEKSNEEIVQDVVKEVILKRPGCLNTYEAFTELKDVGRFITLTRDFPSFGVQGGGFVHSSSGVVRIKGAASQIACGYLYVRAHTGNGALKLWEDPYIKLGDFGGHLVREEALVDRELDGGGTELLFKLGKISYRGDGENTDLVRADWVALLNVTNSINFLTALNTSDQRGVLDEVSIVYKCWSPDTGKETTDCQLSVE
ncbi:MAG: hypothetical protein Q8P55_02220 [bacterium]|nr:hypothetical protein [bacterium]